VAWNGFLLYPVCFVAGLLLDYGDMIISNDSMGVLALPIALRIGGAKVETDHRQEQMTDQRGVVTRLEMVQGHSILELHHSSVGPIHRQPTYFDTIPQRPL